MQIPLGAFNHKYKYTFFVAYAVVDKIDIHGFDVRLERAEKKLHNPLSVRNVELVKEFEKLLFSEGQCIWQTGSKRLRRYGRNLRQSGRYVSTQG
ncbi:MAG: hypothetical protein QXW32_06595 [Nitrososphaerales archaeon]